MHNISLEQYNQLVGSIYEAGLDSGKWQDFIIDLGKVLDGVRIALLGYDIPSRCDLGLVGIGWEENFIDSFHEHYLAINPWFPAIQTRPLCSAHTAEQLLAREVLFKTEFYNDWIKPQENIGTGAGIVLHREDDRMMLINTNIRLKETQEVQDNVVSVLNMLGPHMQRAFQIQRSIGTSQLIDKGYREALDLANNAVFLIDSRGRVSHLNQLAELQLSASGLFYLDSARVLRAIDPKANEAIAQSLRAIKLKKYAELHDAIVLRGKNDHVPLYATIVPFCPDHDATMIFLDFPNATFPIAMLTVIDPSKMRNPARHALITLYRLTPAEAELAEALHHGQSLKIYSESQGISIHTVRSHLKAVFSKTDTNRQSELVVLIGRLMA